MHITNLSNPFRRVRATNATGSFPTKAPTSTKPSGDGVIALSPNGNFGADSPTKLHVLFVGTGADNSTFQARVVIWNKFNNTDGGNSDTDVIWIPQTIYNVDATLGTSVGVSASVIDNNHRFADGLAVTASSQNTAKAELISPANNGVAGLQIETLGAQLVEITFALGTATGANALFRTV